MKGWTLESIAAKGLKATVTGGAGAPAVAAAPKRAHKYGAEKTVVEGITFDSKAEAERFKSLKLLERARMIRSLGLQPVFALTGMGGRAVASYRADFCYFENGRRIVEDVKSAATLTPTARLKFKLFTTQYPDHELRLVDGAGNRLPVKLRYPKVAA